MQSGGHVRVPEFGTNPNALIAALLEYSDPRASYRPVEKDDLFGALLQEGRSAVGEVFQPNGPFQYRDVVGDLLRGAQGRVGYGAWGDPGMGMGSGWRGDRVETSAYGAPAATHAYGFDITGLDIVGLARQAIADRHGPNHPLLHHPALRHPIHPAHLSPATHPQHFTPQTHPALHPPGPQALPERPPEHLYAFDLPLGFTTIPASGVGALQQNAQRELRLEDMVLVSDAPRALMQILNYFLGVEAQSAAIAPRPVEVFSETSFRARLKGTTIHRGETAIINAQNFDVVPRLLSGALIGASIRSS